MLKRTAIFEEHRKLGGRLIDFGGWELPVQYSGVMDEHLACRKDAGLFDVSHMGELEVRGDSAESFLNYLVTNDVSKVSVGQAQYTVMCHEDGGIIDDLIIYKRASDRFLLVVNASNTEKDFAHIKRAEQSFLESHPECELRVENLSSLFSQIAIQGPKAEAILQSLTTSSLSEVKNYWFIEGQLSGGIPALMARTGYTGEDGFEIYVPWDAGPVVWKMLLEQGLPEGMKPCGLGARDTLRLEMKYPLYGNELSDETHPLEAGLGWVVKMNKVDFLGKAALLQKKEEGLTRQLVGLKLLERGIPRHGYEVYSVDGLERLGFITSGTQSPCLKEAIAVAYVKPTHSTLGAQIKVEIRGVKVLGEVVATPFLKRK
jgi:aminomethyltransferase